MGERESEAEEGSEEAWLVEAGEEKRTKRQDHMVFVWAHHFEGKMGNISYCVNW